MTVEEQIHEMGVKARAAATALRAFTTAQKNAALTAIADALDAAKPQIDAANAEDVAAAQANGLAPALVDRLTLLPVTLRFPLDRRLGIPFAGGHREAVIPVPIPNTEVKGLFAEGTAGLARGRVGRRRLFF